MPSPPGSHSGRANVAVLMTTTAVLLIGAELVLRAIYHPQYVDSVIRYDSVLGWSLKPDARVVSNDPDRGFHIHIQTNSLGLREREVTAHKQPGVRRVLIIGDSVVFGSGLETQDRFSDVLGRALADSAEVINAGIPGWGNDQELLFYERTLRALAPDVVVLTVTANNDVVNNALDDALFEGGTKPRFVAEGDSLRMIPPAAAPPLGLKARGKRFLRKSRLLLFVKHRLDQRTETQRVREDVVYAPHGYESFRHLSHWSVYDTRGSDAVATAWTVTERILLRFASDCRADSAAFIVFAMPLKLEMDAPWGAEMIRRTGVDAASLDFDLPYRRLATFCADHGIVFLYPREEFVAAAGAGPLYFDRDSHPNARGNAVTAAWLERTLTAAGLP
jgi:hypothetical protein